MQQASEINVGSIVCSSLVIITPLALVNVSEYCSPWCSVVVNMLRICCCFLDAVPRWWHLRWCYTHICLNKFVFVTTVCL